MKTKNLPICKNCRHAIRLEDFTMCDDAGFAINDEDSFACFTPRDGKVDNAWEMRLRLEDIRSRQDD